MRRFVLLYRALSPPRRRQLGATAALMLVGSAAELASVAAALGFLALFTGAGGAAPSAFAGRLLDWFAGHDLTFAALLLVATVAAAAAVRLYLLALSQRLVTGIAHDLTTAIFARTLSQPYSRFVRRNSSEVLGAMGQVQSITTGILQPGMQGLIAGTIAFFIAALLFAIHPLAASAAAGGLALVYFAAGRLIGRRLRTNAELLATAAAARARMIQESMGAIRDILLDGSRPLFVERFREADERFRRALAANAFIGQAPRFLIEAGGIAAIVLVALLMTRQAGSSLETVPVLGAMALGAHRLLPLLQQVYSAWSSSEGNYRALDDVVAMLAAPVESEAEAAAALPFERDIALEDVSFRYEDGFALDNVTLTVPRGSSVGIVGASGSGKSTLLDLLMGLLEPGGGSVRIDGTPLDAQTRPSWRKHIAHVPQSVFLIDDSIAANVAFCARGGKIDMERVGACVAAACLQDFVATLPNGLATRVGERGVLLSGGQRQRVAVARALYKESSVLVLDEATAALDPETERRLMDSLAAFRPSMTVIMATHRSPTLIGCDAVYRLEGGRLIPANQSELSKKMSRGPQRAGA